MPDTKRERLDRNLSGKWTAWARAAKEELFALYLAIKHPRTPWYAKLLGACVIAYALSPIDLIPDPIPLVGHLDDLVLVPLGIIVVRWLIPSDVIVECRGRARAEISYGSFIGKAGAAVIVVIWVAVLLLLGYWLARASARAKARGSFCFGDS